ncbi:metallopeptidase [Sporormia fimetaria CBS 119925]|uniref:Xaa-Pro aminopeptidase n=1 Tax=Sporormia fimetaria CBS 119925 TaxID=1340428 RepID=A0A6A6V2B6_9PLEO|nr:metallopeptidase [Sporormia fimetaria CBS 119925]
MSACTRLWRPLLRQRFHHNAVQSACAGRRGISVSAADLRFGQPVHETHPHLLKAGEITPGITAQEYYNRRVKLAEKLPAGSVAVIVGADVQYRSGSVFYKFHQDPDFLYLTGFNEPDAVAVIEKLDDGLDHKFHLYVRPKDARAELWEGARSGIDAAEDVFNADVVGNIYQLRKHLKEILPVANRIYTGFPDSIKPDRFSVHLGGAPPGRLEKLVTQMSGIDRHPVSLRSIMNELRVIKSEAEIKNMRKAGQHSGRAFTDAMRQTFTGEKDLESFLDYWFKQDGCDGPAYVPVIAGGSNANTIHYVTNDMLFNPNELVLVDAGAEYGGYITDISRAWPVNGKFTPAQRDMYNMLLSVQRHCVALCHASSGLSLQNLHKITQEQLQDGLKSLGFDTSGDAMDILFPHHVGHYIGLDVHDSPGLSRDRRFEKGMCVTVEPGIYVPDDERWPAWARGMGMRIEDSVCVDEDSPYVLTTEAVKEIVDIEALRD